MTKPKFKKGDWVIVNEKGDSCYSCTTTGSYGVVIGVKSYTYWSECFYVIDFHKVTGQKKQRDKFDNIKEQTLEPLSKLEKALK